MGNGWIILALLACLAAAVEVRKGTIINKPFWEDYFTSDSEVYEYERSIVSKNSDLLDIYNTIRSWKIDNQISQDFTTKQSMSFNRGGYNYKQFYFRSPINQILRLNYNPKVLQPGTVIQLSNSNDYSRGVIPHYVTQDKKNAFDLVFSNGLSGRIEGVINALYSKNMNEKLGDQIDKLNEKNIELYIYKFEEIQKVLRNLGLSSSSYQDLLLTPKNPGETIKKRTTIVLLQPLFTVSVDFPKLPEGKRMNLVEAIFTSKYKFDQFMGTAMYGYWKYNNLPQIISQANYGRLLIITLQQNSISNSQIQSLLGCYREKIFEQDCFDWAMIKIQSNPTIRSYVGGMNTAKAYEQRKNMPVVMQSVNWKKVFFQFNSPESVEQLEPLSANMMNLLGQKYVQIDTLSYYTVTQNKVPEISIRVDEVAVSADVSYRIVGEAADVWLGGFTSPQSMEIGGKIGWNEFTLKISIKGVERKKWYDFITDKNNNYQFKLVMNVIINGQQVLRIRQNSKSQNKVLNLQYKLKALTEQ